VWSDPSLLRARRRNRSHSEASLGQFFQMMMLATAVEGRLIGVNPYGQPGVEAYKKHMNANL
jgi:glucose-6-phosphate isomerase